MFNPKDMFQFWEKTANDYQKAFQQFQNMMPGNIGENPDFNKLILSWEPMTKVMEDWCKQMGEMWVKNLSDDFEKELHKKNMGLSKDIDQRIFDTLHKMSAQNFMESYKKLMESQGKMFEEANQKDPAFFMQMWQNMTTEYLKDLEAIPDHAKKIDFKRLMEIWQKMASQDEEGKKYSERFMESLKVKLQYGMEYYADPEKTEVGLTPKETVLEIGKCKLYHYKPEKVAPDAPPLLIVYSLINKPYILDLLPNVSLIEYFLKKGINVYLIDWGEPDYEDRHITLDHIISPCISEMVDFICKKEKCEQVSMLGHCLGGVLALLYTACYPDKVNRLLTLTTPITGSHGGIVSIWANLMPLEPVIESFGNMPAKLIRYSFIILKPYYEIIRWKRYYEKLDQMSEEAIVAFNAVDKWVNDNVDVPGEAYKKFMKEMYQEDRFSKNETVINGIKIDLSKITCPLLNIVAEDDWIVTPDSAKILNALVGSKEKILTVIPGQHLSLLLDPRNGKIWKDIAAFFLENKNQPKEKEKNDEDNTVKKEKIDSKNKSKKNGEENMRMKDKIVVVTGAARGIGRATVEKFAAHGALVAFCDVDKDAGENFLKELGEQHDFQVINVANRDEVQKWIESIIEKYGKIDAFINNAGITRDNFLVKVKDGELIKQMPEEDFDTVISVNLKGVFNCAQAVAPYMIKAKSGVIINTSSIVALYGNLGQTNYVATKSGVIGMTKVWARELGRYGIRVNSVSPGFIETEMVKKIPERIIDKLISQVPLGRLGAPDELANVYLWLASDEASFVSGANISADGAMVMGT